MGGGGWGGGVNGVQFSPDSVIATRSKAVSTFN